MSDYQYTKALLSADQDRMKLKLRNCTKDDAEEVRLAYFNYLEHSLEERERGLSRRREARSLSRAGDVEDKASPPVEQKTSPAAPKRKKKASDVVKEKDEKETANPKKDEKDEDVIFEKEKVEKSKPGEAKKRRVSSKADEKFLMPNPLFDETDKVTVGGEEEKEKEKEKGKEKEKEK